MDGEEIRAEERKRGKKGRGRGVEAGEWPWSLKGNNHRIFVDLTIHLLKVTFLKKNPIGPAAALDSPADFWLSGRSEEEKG